MSFFHKDWKSIYDLKRLKFSKKNSLIQKYKIISLGWDCLPRKLLTQWGIKPTKAEGEMSYPFDLAMHNLHYVIKILENDFQEYLTKIVYFPEKKEWYNDIYHVIYNHDETLSQKEEFIGRYYKRINNFHHVIKNFDNLIFIYHALPDDLVSDIYKLLQILTKLVKEKNFHLIVISETWQTLDKLPHFSLCYAPYPAPKYVWWEKTYNLDRLKYETRLIKKIFKIIKKVIK